LVGEGDRLGVKLGVKLGVNVKTGVADWSSVGVRETGTVAVMDGCKVGDEVGVWEWVGAGLVDNFPSARESEKPPRIKPMEATAMIIPWNTCHTFFIISSLQATLPRPASAR
jgi:hypothetical protein